MRRLAIVLAIGGCAHGDTAAVDAGSDGSIGSVIPDAGCGDLPCDAIYVAPFGTDFAAGTKAAPLKTITEGISAASMANPPLPVFVGHGTYSEQVTVVAGVSIYGGFDDSWQRGTGGVTEIDGASPVITIDSVQVATLLDSLTIKSADATAAGASSFAVAVTNSKSLEFRNLVVDAGAGANGSDGGNGGFGNNGNPGIAGGPGVEDSSALFCDENTPPAGGNGGSSSCGRTGGRGGSPGVGDGGGQTGLGGVGGTPGGGGGGGGGHGNGLAGTQGTSGTNGSLGAGGANLGTFAGTVYTPANGAVGGSGVNGNGGGGGGGGGGGTTDCDSSGSSGGGGGGGGCGGTAGAGGTGGGGSFGIVIIDSIVVIRSSMVLGGHGGAGGRGGSGGGGGAGAIGGAGGPYGGSSEQDDGGNGAGGGRGGNGGNGGSGGGGGGGPTSGLVCEGAANVQIPGTTLTGGTAGSGGTSAGFPGADGVSSMAVGCSLF